MTEAISDRELIDALGGRLDGHEIIGVRRRPYRYATSAPLEEVIVLAGGEEVGPLILKDLSRERLLGNARAAKPEFLHEPLRELETYRRILGPAGIGPRCLAAASEPERSRYWLLLEKVPGVELWQVGEMPVWREVARWLGGFHGCFAGRLDEMRAANPYLIDCSEAWFRFWCERALAALSASPDERAPALAAALGRFEEVVSILASLPRAFVHGELYPSNVLVVPECEPVAVYPVDWEMAGIGPALVDLAALAGGYGAAEREPLTDAYIEGLAARGGSIPAALAVGLAACRLHLAIQWLGWSADWRPPPEHAHDWLGEALALTGELGLA
ncbi:MAG: aminoglycoside phosphotransferase family protein [Actinomycetota bacterium]